MRKSALIAALTAAVLVVPLGVYASHQFTDVPDSHLFHNAIGWLADNDVTKGCNPPTNTAFCPDDNVTRGQMAAFMKRLSEGQIVDAGALDGKDGVAYERPVSAVTGSFTNGSDFTGQSGVMGSATLEAPADGVVIVQTASGWELTIPATIATWSEIDTAAPCDSYLDGDAIIGSFAPTANALSAAGQGWVNVSSGSHTIHHCVLAFAGTNDNLDHSLIATWYPSADADVVATPAGSPSSSGAGGFSDG